MIYPFLVSMEDYCVKKNNQNHEVIKVIEGTNISLSEMLTPTIIDSAGSNHTETKTMNTSITALRRQLLRRTHVTAAILDEQKLSTEIPKVIYQTYHHPEEIPPKVAANLAKYAADYQRFVLDDDKCIEFLTKHYHEAVIKTFGLLGGAHKADLFRYAILYLKGGVYLDIKTELLMPLESVFPPKSPGPRGITYTAIDAVGNMLYQGIIASPKGNPAFLYGIQEFVQSQKPVRSYFMSTDQMYKTIGVAVGSPVLKTGLNSVLTSNTTIAADLTHNGKHASMDVSNNNNANHFNSSSSNSNSNSNSISNKTAASSSSSSSAAATTKVGARHERTRARALRRLLSDNNSSSSSSSSSISSSSTSTAMSDSKGDSKIDSKGGDSNNRNSSDSNNHGRGRTGNRKASDTNNNTTTTPPTATAAASSTTTTTTTTTSIGTLSSAAIANNLYQFDYFLFQEKGFPAKECYDGVDRYPLSKPHLHSQNYTSYHTYYHAYKTITYYQHFFDSHNSYLFD